jgi:hypothetical protein
MFFDILFSRRFAASKSRFPEKSKQPSGKENVDTHVNANSIQVSLKIFTVQTFELLVRVGTFR